MQLNQFERLVLTSLMNQQQLHNHQIKTLIKQKLRVLSNCIRMTKIKFLQSFKTHLNLLERSNFTQVKQKPSNTSKSPNPLIRVCRYSLNWFNFKQLTPN